MRWGLLSTANINRKLLAGAEGTDEATVAAVASRDRSRAEAFAREHGIERALGSYEALLEDPEIDAVYNPLPNSMHVPWTVRALEAGKHVLCEKPMSRHPDQVEAAFAAARQQGRHLEEAFMWRHHPQTHKLRELLDAGAVGRLRMVTASFSFPLADVSDIRMQAGLDGGSLMDVGCYCVSGCRLVAGAEPERVHAEHAIGGDDVDVSLAGTLRFPDDVIGQFHCGFAIGGRAPPRGDRGGRLAVPRRPLARGHAGDRAAARGRDRADRDRARQSVHARADRLRARRPRRRAAAAGRGRCARPGAGDRGAVRLGSHFHYERTDVKTSLGIWALGGMVTRFVPEGYQPEHGRESTVEKVQRAVAGLEGLVDDYEFHYPGELSEDNLDEVRDGARRPRDLLHRERPARRPPLRQGRPHLGRPRRARDRAGDHARGGELRRRARRALHHLARDRGLQLPVPGALPRELGAG